VCCIVCAYVVGLASPTDEFVVYNGERICVVIEVTFPGEAGHASLFIDDNAAEKLVCVCVFQFCILLYYLQCSC